MVTHDRAVAASPRCDEGVACKAAAPPAGAATPEHPNAVPVGPLPTAGAPSPESDAPAVSQAADPGWGTALSFRRSHYVAHWGVQGDYHYGREVGMALDGWPALIDKRGLEEGERLPRCSACTRQLEGKPRPDLGDRP